MTNELIPLTLATETLALVPAHALSWHQVQLPPGALASGLLKERAAPRARAVLEGLLEDRLLDEPAQLHFALQPDARASGPVWVAVCDRAWLRAELERLAQQGRTPQRLVPEWAPDAPRKELWITGSEDAPQALWVDDQGVHRLPLPQGADAGSSSWLAVRDSAALWAEPAVAAIAEKVLDRAPRVTSTAERLQLRAQSGWDLAQFEFSRRNPLLERLQHAALSFLKADHWRPARLAVLAIAVVHLVGLNAYAWHVNAQTQAQRAQLRAMLSETFPKVQVIVDAPVQMQRELDLLRQSRGAARSSDLDSMLAAVGNTASVGGSAVSLDYAPGELRLTVPGLPADRATTVDADLRNQGLSVQQDGATLLVRPRGATP